MKTALITGATSGIGKEFAVRLAGRGYRLIVTGRRTDRLEELADELNVPVRIITADMSDEDNCKEFLQEISDENVDVFINNAGFGACGAFTDTDLDKEISMIHVNDIAQHILFKEILKRMCKRNRGIICNVASSAGLLPAGPYMATYYATKAYMVSLTRAVARELREAGSRVHVCALCPGPVDTEFNKNADVEFALPGITAQACVNEALIGMNMGRVIIAPTPIIKLAVIGQRFLPTNIAVAMTARQQRKKIQE